MADHCTETHQGHGKYRGTTAFHEAGYDSLLTAQVAVRLSTKLEAAGTYIDDTSEATSADEAGGVTLNGAAANFTPGDRNPPARVASTLSSAIGGLRDLVSALPKALAGDSKKELPHAPTPPTSITKEESSLVADNGASTAVASTTSNSKATKKQKKRGSKKSSTQIESKPVGRFAHATAFDQLQDTAQEDSDEEVLQFDELPSSTTTMTAPVVADTDGVSDNRIKVSASDWDTPWWRRESGRAMPGFDSDFWGVYGNKLRVFGTQEGVCLLDQ